MNNKFLNKKVVVFLIFFLLTIGNGAYINSILQYKVEFAALGLLLFSTFVVAKKNFYILKKYIMIIICSFILTLGALYYDISKQSILMIFLTSFLLMNYSLFSNFFISDNDQIKTVGNALLCGMIFNAFIGLFTGTLGLSFDSKDIIIFMLFKCGINIKNYCGGIWLVIFISYYIYYYRNNNISKHLFRFIILGLLLLFSGSKGACFLAMIFVLGINFKKVFNFNSKQSFAFYCVLIVIIVISSIYVYKNVLINIPTYAYRMRGINKIINIISHDISRFVFGFSDIAYADTGFDYTINMRNFLGWESSIEMAYVNIIIKNGFLGYIIYYYLFKNIFKNSKKIKNKEKNIVQCLAVIMLFSGLTETYIASLHYVVGPTLFCLIYGIIQDKSCFKIDNKCQNKPNN